VSAPAEAAPGLALLADLPGFARVRERLERHGDASVGGLWGSSQALLVAALARVRQEPFVVCCSTEVEARQFADDLRFFGAESVWFPARASFSTGANRAHADLESVRTRLQVAQKLVGPPEGRPRLLVTSLLALLQPIPNARDIEREFLNFAVGERLNAEHLLARLVKGGYERVPLAETPGDVSLRGDILDVFPFAADLPLRIELFDDEIESLRTFDPVDQRSVETLDAVEVCMVNDAASGEDEGHVEPMRVLAPTACYVEVEPLRVQDVADGLRVQRAEHGQALLHLDQEVASRARLRVASLPAEHVNFDTRSVQGLAVGMAEAPGALREVVDAGGEVVVVCQTEGEEKRFRELMSQRVGLDGIRTATGSLGKGFRLAPGPLVVVGHRELVGILGRTGGGAKGRAHRTRAIQSFFELKVGDHVVHAVHGMARFHGLKKMERGGGTEEHLHLVFADEVSVFVPASRIDIVQRYIGASAAAPALDKVGGSSFRKRKEKVQKALYDLAGELLEVHARRMMKRRPTWGEDDELVREMIAEFPYEDTPDQATTDAEVHADLASDRPMDRLICGDVGFGKTELAIRAAFRVASRGGKVVVLVPTTVLASQHHDTFRQRLADFPLTIEMLSRYVAPRQRKEILERASAGKVDILIGTHRLLSKDVKLDGVGLVIIDEEQRFGVTHKEHFKKLRAEVDLLTLSATPIPRTLHMSLSGVRDISALTSPPEGRQEIDTILTYVEEEEELREAILREKNRGGQVFYLYNRVQSIGAVAQRVQQLVPECTYAVGHGQMGGKELEKVMRAFTRGEVDVLIATTIIESGLDVPAAGTIVVHDADHFGLSELHQLRGRVGRGSQRGYCYLLIEKTKPIRDVARERLKALEEMNHLGAGFQISMKDLEIRGAGNVLGPQQSGHIGAVGYDLYCRLLKATVERLQQGMSLEEVQAEDPTLNGVELELGLEAYLPDTWIGDVHTRIEILRELSEVPTLEQHEEYRAGLRDRFGRIPAPAEALLRSFRLRLALQEAGITRVAWQQDRYLLQFADRLALERLFGGHGVDLRTIRTGLAHLVLPPGLGDAAAALDWLEPFVLEAVGAGA
jgi:transcription-repair coupling factor (superfamily II helicase)